ncbi:MAG: class IV adenylate cyclase [Candidatus Acidiferrales bacterium]
MSDKISSKREIEIKLFVTDLAGILRRLRKLGAASRGRVHELNTLFDTPDSGFRRSGRLLRLRQQTPAPGNNVRGGLTSAILTAKAPPLPGPRSSRTTKKRLYKEVQENEEQIKDPRRLSHALKGLGFRPGFRYEKYRTSFRLNSLHLDLDETPIGAFLELEGTPAAINRTARALGFTPRDYIRSTYWTLYAADCRRHRRKPQNMLFAPQNSR